MKYAWAFWGLIILALLVWSAFQSRFGFVVVNDQTDSTQDSSVESIQDQSEEKIADEAHLVLPVNQFFARITKKPFGVYITPETSPVQPEKFTGYHTGVDVEFVDLEYLQKKSSNT